MYFGWMIRLAAVLLALYVGVSFLRMIGPASPPQASLTAVKPGAVGKPGVTAAVAVLESSGADENRGRRIVTPNSVFFSCALGTALGAASLAAPPVAAWAFTAGALPSAVAVALTSASGCGVGMVGGVVLSTFGWMFSKVGSAWSSVFG